MEFVILSSDLKKGGLKVEFLARDD